MTEQAKIDKTTAKPTGLALLREPFPANQISKLPKPTKRQTEIVREDFKKGVRCKLCGAWHHPDVVHLDYVGHAALTDRLLDCDPAWNWEPVALDDRGAPMLDGNGGMWIRLTVCGQTRLGYGHPDGKKGGDAVKEVIGDALRNAAMRFGAALDFWHKGDLHGDDEPPQATEETGADDAPTPEAIRDKMKSAIAGAATTDDLAAIWSNKAFQADLKALPAPMKAEIEKAKNDAKDRLSQEPEDEIPY